MKRSNIVRKQARRRCWNKAGCWRVKILVNSLSCESLDWRDAVCWQITQRSFVSDWQWACVEQRDAGHTRIKIELDKIGTKKQEELNLRRHELIIGFQHLPWKRLAKWARQLNGSQAGTAKRTKMATYLGTTLSRHLLQTSRWLWDQDCWLVGAAIVLPEEACQVVQEKAEEIGVKVIIVVLRIIIHQLAGKDFCEVKMDTPRHPPRKTAFQVDRKDLKFILCGIGRS